MQNLILYKWVVQKSRTEITPTVASAWSDFGLKYWNQQAQAQASVGILGRGRINMWRNLNKPQALKICLNHKRPIKLTSAQAQATSEQKG